MISKRRGFTLIELLVVITILMILAGILAPSVNGVIARVHMVRCQSNLQSLGAATAAYASANDGYFFAGSESLGGFPVTTLYYWGTNTNPVVTKASPLIKYVKLDALLCPALPWGEYVPEASLTVPATTYGYNAYCLDPASIGMPGSRKTRDSIADPSQLFVFVDAAAVNTWTGGGAFQNVTYVDPPQGMTDRVPMTHFRHTGYTANALCADGHAASFTTEDEVMIDVENSLSFVGKLNRPHYDQK